jgi:hypothetical protein
MTSIIRQLITEYHGKGMSLADILEKQIEPEHLVHEFIRIYKEMYPNTNPVRAINQPMDNTLQLDSVPIPLMDAFPGQQIAPYPGPEIVTPSRYQHPLVDSAIRNGPVAQGQKMIFACANGYLDLVECRFMPVKTLDAQTLNSKVNYPFIVIAIYPPPDAADRLGLQKFLDQIFPNPEVQNYVLNLYAEKLDGMRRREEFIIHLGSGANGKSTFQQLLKLTFGDYYQNAHFSIQNAIKQDTRIVMFSGGERDSQNFGNTVKELVAGMQYIPMSCGRDFLHNFGMYMSNMERNTLPVLDDAGLKRRIKVIPYTSRFCDMDYPKHDYPGEFPNHYPRDECICDKLKNYAPYFLEMLFERYKTLNANGFTELTNMP